MRLDSAGVFPARLRSVPTWRSIRSAGSNRAAMRAVRAIVPSYGNHFMYPVCQVAGNPGKFAGNGQIGGVEGDRLLVWGAMNESVWAPHLNRSVGCRDICGALAYGSPFMEDK